MQRIYLLIVSFTFSILGFGQQFEYRIAKQTYAVDSVYEQILAYEKLGIKYSNTPTFDSATYWLIGKYEKLGYSPVVDSFSQKGYNSTNVIIEKRGQDSSRWILVGAHYDSEKTSPGANDNGSGIAATLQIAKIIKDIDTKLSIRIINFGAEEQGFLGSYHYANTTLSQKDEVVLMLNLDQLGGTRGESNDKIVCERDEDTSPSTNNVASYLKTDTLMNLIRLYTNLTPVVGQVERSDYEPFEDLGMVVTGLYQESNYPHYHNSTDVVANMDVDATTEVIKGALAATLYFAGIDIIVGVEPVALEIPYVFPNPASDFLEIKNVDIGSKLLLQNSLGQKVLEMDNPVSQSISLSGLRNGCYIVSIIAPKNAKMYQSKLIIAR